MILRSHRWFRPLLMCFFIVSMSLLFGYAAFNYRFLHSEGICITFKDAPSDDKSLREWLEHRDGVSNVEIARKPGLIVIRYHQLRALFDRPLIPDILTECEKIGYASPVLVSTNHG